jgi:hypothetical protein
MVAIQAFFIFLAAVVSPVRASEDICSTTDTGLSGKELAVTCYVGNFLTKMLGWDIQYMYCIRVGQIVE